MSDPIRLLRAGTVATLLIDRPDRRNAMDRAMWRALPHLVAEAVADRKKIDRVLPDKAAETRGEPS